MKQEKKRRSSTCTLQVEETTWVLQKHKSRGPTFGLILWTTGRKSWSALINDLKVSFHKGPNFSLSRHNAVLKCKYSSEDNSRT